jgi:hypothetical protein
MMNSNGIGLKNTLTAWFRMAAEGARETSSCRSNATDGDGDVEALVRFREVSAAILTAQNALVSSDENSSTVGGIESNRPNRSG